jgi:hypothetical protein
MAFSNHFMDRFMLQGGDYLRLWQSRSAVVIGVFAICFLLLVEVNSAYLIRCIIEYLLSFWVVDKVNQFRDSIFLPVPIAVSVEFYPPPKELQLTKYDLVEIPLRHVKHDTLIIDPLPAKITSRARRSVRHFVTKSELINYLKTKSTKGTANPHPSGSGNVITAKIGGSVRHVMEDWVRL